MQRRQSRDLAYPSILSRHFERQFEQEAERQITRFQSPNSKKSYIAELQQDQKIQSNDLANPYYGRQEPGVVNIPGYQQNYQYYSDGQQQYLEKDDQLNDSEQNNPQKPNAFLQVDKLNSNKWGIDIQEVCEFWASHKKQIIQLKQWHFSQKNAMHWHLQLLIHFHNELMDNISLSNHHAESVLSFFKSLLDHQKDYAAKLQKCAKNLHPKIKSHPKIEYRQNPSSTNPKDIIPVQSAFNRFNLIFAQQQKEIACKKIQFVHFLKTKLCQPIKMVNKDVINRIQKYVPSFSKARKTLDSLEKDVEKAFQKLSTGFDSFERTIFRRESDISEEFKRKIKKPSPLNCFGALGYNSDASKQPIEEEGRINQPRLNNNRIRQAVQTIIAQNKGNKKAQCIKSADGKIEEDIWLLERQYLFSVKLWHDQLTEMGKLVIAFWRIAIQFEIKRKGAFKQMAKEFFSMNKSSMSGGSSNNDLLERLQQFISGMDVQNEVDMLYHHKEFLTVDSQNCYNKLKIAQNYKPHEIKSVKNLTKLQFKDEIEQIKVEKPPKSGLIVTYGKLRRDPGIFSSWKVCTAALTRNNYLVLFDNDTDKKPSIHIYLPYYSIQHSKNMKSKEHAFTLHQIVKYPGGDKKQADYLYQMLIRITLKALSQSQLDAWFNCLSNISVACQ